MQGSFNVLTFRNSFCHTAAMSVAWRYRGRSITSEEIDFLRRLLRDHPELSRWKLSRQVCEA